MPNIPGTPNNDSITGSAENDTIDGGAGNDSIYGDYGDDRIIGGTGNDTLYGGPDNDWIVAGDGDTADGGSGTDRLEFYIAAAGTDGLLFNAATSQIRHGTRVVLNHTGFEQFIIHGTDNADTMIGGAGDDLFRAYGGNDSVQAGSGNDHVEMGTGRGSADGGTGFDELSANFADETAGVRFDAAVRAVTNTRGEVVLTQENFESFYIDGTTFGDTIRGGNNRNVLSGGAGSDSLAGGSGFDLLYGGTGNDTLDLADGFGTAYGEDGADLLMADFSTATGPVRFNATSPDILVGGTATVHFEGIESYSIRGGTNADTLAAGTGNDTLYGGAADDILIGGAGNDLLDMGTGGGTADGGTGTDTLRADFSSASAAIDFNVLLPEVTSLGATILTHEFFERFVIDGSAYDDRLTGSTAADSLGGGGGNDMLSGQEGDDSLGGGDGDDFIDGGSGNDILNGDAGSDTLYGGEGNDAARMDTGGGLAVGGGGTDFLGVDFGNEAAGVTFRAAQPRATSGTRTVLTQTGFENFFVEGTNSGDFIESGAGTDYLRGRHGNDTINAGAGDDVVEGGLGRDSLLGGTGIDTIQDVWDANMVLTNTTLTTTPNALAGVWSSAAPVAIPDNAVVSSKIAINPALYSGHVYDLRVELNITHAYNPDLDVVLVSPSGKRVTLFNDVPDLRSNFNITVLDDNATTSILAGTAPYTGSFRPVMPLHALAGETATGEWTVEITDDAPGDTGTLDSWHLLFSGGPVTDTLSGFEKAFLVGGESANTLNAAAFTGSVYLYGLAGGDRLTGSSGADTLDGGEGADTIAGGPGNDTYIVDAAGDLVVEALNAGIDTIQTSVSRTLGANQENLVLTGAAAINGIGNTLNNRLTGNAATNILIGGGGRDILVGGGGNDRLQGTSTVAPFGAAEIDTLTGGTGNDIFILGVAASVLYNDATVGTSGINGYALITDFGAGDKLQIKGPAAGYYLGASPAGLPVGQALFRNDSAAPAADELIAIIQGPATATSLISPVLV